MPVRSASGVLIGRTVRAEWTKIRTLGSARRTLVGAMTISVGPGAAIVGSDVSQWDAMTAK